MALTIYGFTPTRTRRVLWMAKELGLDFKSVQTTPGEGSRSPEHLKINPNGHIPAIDDDGVLMFESLAINLYLLKKHGGPLMPKTIVDEGLMGQWSFWAMTELEPQVMPVLFGTIRPEATTPEAVAAAKERLPQVLKVLDGSLAGKDYLLGGGFSGADLNVASVLSFLQMIKYDFSLSPNVAGWLDRCLGRPAFAAALAVKAS